MLLMGIPSITELMIIFGVVFLLFGAKKLPELGGAIGESIKNFKKGIKDNEGDGDAKKVEQARLEAQRVPGVEQATKVEVVVEPPKN
jgi:sec-independent protein translocase protein TatA